MYRPIKIRLLIFLGCCLSCIELSAQPIFNSQPEKYLLGLISSDEWDENCLSFNRKGDLIFFTRGNEWDKQLGFLASKKKEEFTEPVQLFTLDTIYNGAISPSGKRILYCKRLEEQTEIWLVERSAGGWGDPVNLTASSGIAGGYFNWYNESEIYFYTPENEGDLVMGRLKNGTLSIVDRLDALNTKKGTEFSPYIDRKKAFIVFTRYLEGDKDQQGFFISRNEGTKRNPVWAPPEKISELPYGWGAFISRSSEYFYFTDGVDIYQSKLSE